MGEYPGREFTEVPEGSTSAAPSPPRAPKKQVADVVEDSEDLDDTHFTSGDEGDSVIPAAPLSSRPPLCLGKKILLKFGLDAS
jgi:hypothetical protein